MSCFDSTRLDSTRLDSTQLDKIQHNTTLIFLFAVMHIGIDTTDTTYNKWYQNQYHLHILTRAYVYGTSLDLMEKYISTYIHTYKYKHKYMNKNKNTQITKKNKQNLRDRQK